MNRSPGAVRMLWVRALAALREAMQRVRQRSRTIKSTAWAESPALLAV